MVNIASDWCIVQSESCCTCFQSGGARQGQVCWGLEFVPLSGCKHPLVVTAMGSMLTMGVLGIVHKLVNGIAEPAFDGFLYSLAINLFEPTEMCLPILLWG